jgi:hypothetical protein
LMPPRTSNALSIPLGDGKEENKSLLKAIRDWGEVRKRVTAER